ncbi:MAG: amidohydrolase [Flavobacterium sp.]|nr:amidohydrolase [Flavobacterium sp.]
MKNELNIALIQGPLLWHDAAANRAYFEERIRATNEVDLFVLPEMFTTGFTMEPSVVAENMEGATVEWMRNMAMELRCAITGSVVIGESGQFYNRLIFAAPDGSIQTYDKRHLFSLAHEDQYYKAGQDKLIVEYRGWRLCPLVCYDLRFPVFARNANDYDVLLFVANWPEQRIDAWDKLLVARAIENMAYVVATNRTGLDVNGHNYPGHSQVVNELGQYIIEPGWTEGVLTATLSYDKLQNIRKKFGFLDDRDNFTVV